MSTRPPEREISAAAGSVHVSRRAAQRTHHNRDEAVTPDQYIHQVLSKYDVTRGGQFNPLTEIVSPLSFELQQTFGNELRGLQLSGSNAKGTAVIGSTDVDLFLSFAPVGITLRDNYQAVFDYAQRAGYAPRKQNVSIGITYGGKSVDLVPGRRQPTPGYHSLYRRRVNTWTQTNVDLHIQKVRNSGRTAEIRALKIWRNQHRLDFPSFYLELLTLEGMNASRTYSFADRVLAGLRYFASHIERSRIIDPSNTNNIISDDLTAAEKRLIAAAAAHSASRPSWGEIFW